MPRKKAVPVPLVTAFGVATIGCGLTCGAVEIGGAAVVVDCDAADELSRSPDHSPTAICSATPIIIPIF